MQCDIRKRLESLAGLIIHYLRVPIEPTINQQALPVLTIAPVLVPSAIDSPKVGV